MIYIKILLNFILTHPLQSSLLTSYKVWENKNHFGQVADIFFEITYFLQILLLTPQSKLPNNCIYKCKNNTWCVFWGVMISQSRSVWTRPSWQDLTAHKNCHWKKKNVIYINFITLNISSHNIFFLNLIIHTYISFPLHNSSQYNGV